MKNYKKVIASLLATTMVMGSSAVVFAGDDDVSTTPSNPTGTETGTGTLEQVEAKKIFKVMLPVMDENTFNFIIDPEKLIDETDGAKYGNAQFETGATLFFNSGQVEIENPKKDEDDEPEKITVDNYTSHSKVLEAYNLGTDDVNVTVNAKADLANASGITLNSTGTFAQGTTDTPASEIYLQLQAVEVDSSEDSGYKVITGETGDVVDKVVDTTGVELKDAIKATEDAYEVTVKGDKYVKTIADSFYKEENGKKVLDLEQFSDSHYMFWVKGQSNDKGIWDNVAENAAPALTVTWTIEKPEGAVNADEAADGTVTMDENGLVTVTLTNKDNDFASMVISTEADFEAEDGPTNWGWTAQPVMGEWTGNTRTITQQMDLDWLSGQKMKAVITLADGTELTATYQY